MTRKRCLYCGRWYRPDRRAARVQKSCVRPSCRAERRRGKQRSWLKRHPGYGRSRRLKVRAWAAAYPDYWRDYRSRRPDYAARDNQRRRRARRAAQNAAKQTESPRRVEAFLDALIASLAPQNKSAWHWARGFGDNGGP